MVGAAPYAVFPLTEAIFLPLAARQTFLWELQSMGLGKLARIREQRADNQAAMLELYRTQYRIAAEVASARPGGLGRGPSQ